MKRSAVFDPPEYVNWTLDPVLLDQYSLTLEQHPERRHLLESLTPLDHLHLYEGLVRNRLHDTFLKRWVKQGVISKAWLGTGEEASTIGPVHALQRGRDVVGPMIRNAGACLEFGMPVADLFRGYLATEDSPTRGRDLHVGDLKVGVMAPISHVGALVPVMAGFALSFKLRREEGVALTWIGDGSTKTGEFHEGLSLASALHLPLIVIIQNNQVALGTRLNVHHRGSFLALADAYGIPGAQFDGNHVLDAWAATRWARQLCREGRGPVLLVGETFRMGGHATHDEREARQVLDPALFQDFGKRDPIGLYEAWLERAPFSLPGAGNLRERSIGNRAALEGAEARVEAEVEAAGELALLSRRTSPPDISRVGEGVYAL